MSLAIVEVAKGFTLFSGDVLLMSAPNFYDANSFENPEKASTYIYRAL